VRSSSRAARPSPPAVHGRARAPVDRILRELQHARRDVVRHRSPRPNPGTSACRHANPAPTTPGRRPASRSWPAWLRSPSTSSSPVAAGVAHADIAVPVVRMVEVERCALPYRLAATRAHRQPGRHKRLEPAACHLMPVAVPPLRSLEAPRTHQRLLRDREGSAMLPRQAKNSLTEGDQNDCPVGYPASSTKKRGRPRVREWVLCVRRSGSEPPGLLGWTTRR
jgi:hypothetical protein